MGGVNFLKVSVRDASRENKNIVKRREVVLALTAELLVKSSADSNIQARYICGPG